MPDAADLAALAPVAEALKSLGVDFYIGGSVASNVHGVWRSTMDTDLVAWLRRQHVAPFVMALQRDFYVSADMILDAIARRASFNVIHENSSQKIDVFIPKGRPFDEAARKRAVMKPVSADGAYLLPVASPEDTILTKLEWYRMNNEVSDKQWSDVRSVIRIKQDGLDWPYMQRWAAELGVGDLLDRARQAVSRTFEGECDA